ncbi:hypothetical protein ACGFZG_08700 [Streptomyces antibioticus]
MILTVFFPLAALAALAGLALVGPRTVPPVAGTLAVLVTAAALAVALHR